MVRMDGAETRKERISQVAKTIQSALFQNKEVGWVSLSKMVAKIMIETGLTKHKIVEYLEILQSAGQFQIDLENEKIVRASG